MGDVTRPSGVDLVPAALRDQVGDLIGVAEEILDDMELFAVAANEVAVAVEARLAGLDDSEHWAVAEAVGLRRMLSLLDRLTGGGEP